MLCQVCGAKNPDDRDFCVRCHQKLLVLSGKVGLEEDDEPGEEEGFSFDEHLLERISILEEAMKRTAELLRQMLDGLRRHERSLLSASTGLSSLQELLHKKRVLGRDEWNDHWETRLEEELRAVDRRDRFAAVRDRLAALYEGDKKDAFQGYLAEAEQAFLALDSRRALGALEHAFRLDRGNVELAYFLGETYWNDGDAEAALPFLARVLELEPRHYDALVYSGVIQLERGADERAEELLKRAAALAPEAFLPQLSLGTIHARRGELARAVPFLERAIEIDPAPQALFLLGNVFYEMGKSSAAITQLTAAVKRDPSFEEAYDLLGLALLERGWNVRALQAFRQAQRLNPRSLRYADVVRFLSGSDALPLPEVGGEARALLAQGDERLGRADRRGALAAYRKALALDPENPTLLMSYALVCSELELTQELETVARKVLELAPGERLEATASAALIEALRSQGRFREGNRIGQRLLDEARSSFTKTIAYYEIAYNLAEMEEDLDRALEYAQSSLEHAPDELKPFPLAALGWVHYKRREFDQAVDFLARASELGPTASTLSHLGMALLAAGKEQEAKEVFARARQLAGRGDALGSTMMGLMRESASVLQRVRRGPRR